MRKLLFICSILANMSLQAQAFTPVDGPVDAGVGTWLVGYSNSGTFAAAPNFTDNTVSVLLGAYNI